MTTIRAVLWDADGVLQRAPGGAEESIRPAVAGLVDDVDGFWSEALAEERPALTGRARWLDVLPGLLERWGIASERDRFVRMWLSIEPVEDARAMVGALRSHGIACYIASNQDAHRARHMQQQLGYGDLLDGTFYSHDLGLAKPDPAYFTEILQRLGRRPEEVLFVDDNADNIASARSVGLAAEVWSHHQGVELLRRRLRNHGLPESVQCP